MYQGRQRCMDCDHELLLGGRCADCHGTGLNVHLNSDDPKCRSCGGTGVCPTCHGDCYVGGASLGDGDIQKLFE